MITPAGAPSEARGGSPAISGHGVVPFLVDTRAAMDLAPSMIQIRSLALVCPLLWALGCGGSSPPPASTTPSGTATSGTATSGTATSGTATPGTSTPAGASGTTGQGAGDPAKSAGSTPGQGAAGDPGTGAPGGASSDAGKPLTGTLERQEIGAAVGRQAALFNDCYTIGAGKGVQFKAVVTVKATIGPTGSVTQGEIIKSTANNPKVDACVLNAFKKVQFPAPKAGASVITFPMEFDGADQVPVQKVPPQKPH